MVPITTLCADAETNGAAPSTATTLIRALSRNSRRAGSPGLAALSSLDVLREPEWLLEISETAIQAPNASFQRLRKEMFMRI
ncbi:hypothetical protein L3V85_10500 [Variovorax paradoxus]|nr:hypothetical protein L3V85_10500 [Variovorax paradoxus]